MFRVLLTAATIVFGTHATAQDCDRITDAGQRLACFDAGNFEPGANEGNINYKIEVDPITDEATTMVRVRSFDPNSGSQRATRHMITVHCAPDGKLTTTILLIMDGFQRRLDAIARWDNEQPIELTFNLEPTGYAPGLFGEESTKFMAKMITHARLAVRVQSEEYDTTTTAVFNLTGLQRAITDSAMSCNVTL